MRPSKSKAQRIHSQRRARQRYGIMLTPEKHDQVIQDIKKGQAVCLERQSNRVTIHAVVIEDKLVKVVYDGQRETLASALPLTDVKVRACGCGHWHCRHGCQEWEDGQLCPCGKCDCEVCGRKEPRNVDSR